MGKTLIQIYEIQTPGEARTMAELGVDHIGGVIQEPAGMNDPELKKAVGTVQGMGKKYSLIPLFTRQDDVLSALDRLKPDMVHFCDSLVDLSGRPLDQSPFIELQKEVRDSFGSIQIMRSIPIAPPGFAHLVPSLDLARELEPFSDWFLTDTFFGENMGGQTDPVEGFIGITGKTSDWDVAADLVRQASIPVILAGGLGPDNVVEAMAKTRPAGVDSCSNTNLIGDDGRPVRFRKDPQKVRRMVERVRRADNGAGS